MSAHVFNTHEGRSFCSVCGCERKRLDVAPRGVSVRRWVSRWHYRNGRGDWQRVPPPCRVVLSPIATRAQAVTQ